MKYDNFPPYFPYFVMCNACVLFFFFQVLQLTKNTDKLAAQNTSSAAASITANRTTSNTAAAAVAFIPMGQPKSNLDQTCDDNLCFNGGYCDPMTQQCQCRGHYIGK